MSGRLNQVYKTAGEIFFQECTQLVQRRGEQDHQVRDMILLPEQARARISRESDKLFCGERPFALEMLFQTRRNRVITGHIFQLAQIMKPAGTEIDCIQCHDIGESGLFIPKKVV